MIVCEDVAIGRDDKAGTLSHLLILALPGGAALARRAPAEEIIEEIIAEWVKWLKRIAEWPVVKLVCWVLLCDGLFSF